MTLMKQPAAAEYLGVSHSFLEKRRVYGGGPKFVRIGRRVAYRKADLDEWIASHVVGSTSESAAA